MKYRTRTNPRAHRLILRLDTAGNPIVTAPRFTPQWFIQRFINSQQDWITKHRQTLKAAHQSFHSDSQLNLFGKTYQKVIQPTTGVSKVTIQGETVTIAVHTGKGADTVLANWLKNTAAHYLVPRVHALAKKMKVEFKKLTLRAQKTRWGSCNSAGNLNFNWKLVHFEPKIIDSVIIHELAHRKHLNHSQDFWRFVARFDADYRLHRGWLKRNGIGVV